MTDLVMRRTAVISRCGRYRYQLARAWDDRRPPAVFVMLNPSTADAAIDDPTIRRCIGFAQRWDCGALVVVNLFAWRATRPTDLKIVRDPVGPEADVHIMRTIDYAKAEDGPVICAWGAHGDLRDRARVVTAMILSAGIVPQVLRMNASGSPAHPLYSPYSCSLSDLVSR